jgi:plasmid stabilization system protein ParE
MSAYGFHPEALLDLDEIWEYIARDSLEAADRVTAAILARIAAIAPFPHQGYRRPDLDSRGLRYLRVYDYLIAYVPENPLSVIAVLHGRRSPRVMAAILRDRR